jgi:hypothetical protein
MNTTIPQHIVDKWPDLMTMLNQTDSMDNSEKEYWISMLPTMSEVHIEKLYNILANEKKKLTEIENKYNASKNAEKIGEHYTSTIETIKKNEGESNKKEEELEQALLDSLEDL